ncbi:MAG: citrate lyase acyl carrier protein [Spirochaetia bacterium]|jgi:citrate lyase subunit gamma (acyl carrier protein)|nr:citrate lyase acyl carrier protein [Spirochaetia bacterium]
MKIVKTGMAGTLESSDVLVTVRENPGKGVEILLQSIVEKQFGKQIKKVVKEKLQILGIDEAVVQLNDKGALDCTIEARLAAAVYRASGITSYNWEKI